MPRTKRAPPRTPKMARTGKPFGVDIAAPDGDIRLSSEERRGGGIGAIEMTMGRWMV